VERRRRFCAEDVETPFLEKLLSGDGIEVAGDLARVLTAKSWWRVKKSSEKDLVAEKEYP
jgi:hypothetical protein